MISTGDYIIQYYTAKGSKLKELKESHSGGLMEAKEMGEETIESQGANPMVHSFSVDLRVFNSLDPNKF